MRQTAVNSVEWLHFRIFGREMSPTMRSFIVNTGWSFAGVFLSAALFFALNVIAGRVLGPEGYGRYNLVVAIAASLAVFMAAGFDTASVKYVSQHSDPEKKAATMSNAFLFVFPFSLVVATILFLFRNQIASIFHVDGLLIGLALLFTVLYTYKSLLNGFIQGLQRFKFQAGIKVLEALVATALFILLFFILSGFRTYQGYLYALMLGSVTTILVYFLAVRKNLKGWNKAVFKEQRSYLRTVQLFTIVGILLTSADRLFVARYMGAQELGMYGAYLFSATTIVSQFVLVVDNVFFPMVNQVADKRLMLHNINRFLIAAAVPVFLVTCAISYCIILLFGSQYGVRWSYITLVSAVAFLQIAASMYVTLMASSTVTFRVSTYINFAKPIVIGLLYAGAVIFHWVNIPVVLCILALSHIFDIVNIRATFRLVESADEPQ